MRRVPVGGVRSSVLGLAKAAAVLIVLAAVVWAWDSGLISLLARIAWLYMVTGARG